MKNEIIFRDEVQILINRFGIDNELNIRDFVLAKLITSYLYHLKEALVEEKRLSVVPTETNPCDCKHCLAARYLAQGENEK